MHDPDTFLDTLSDKKTHFYSLKKLAELYPSFSSFPYSIKIMMESLLRNCDEKRVKKENICRLAEWSKEGPYEGEVPFIVSRVILQDFTGVPLLVDLAAMREAAAAQGRDPRLIEPIVPVDLVVDHSVQVDRSRTPDSYLFNLNLEFQRNQERYSFLKWGQEAFKSFKVIPPGIGIVHQVNLEFLAQVVIDEKKKHLIYPDTLVGTDSHTTMINGLGILGWGVGGIEATAAMLGQPVSLQIPQVIGVYLTGKLKEGVTATDLTLSLTERLRAEKVVGKFVEFFGPGVEELSVVDRATIANMAPEYGATIGFFPVDDKTLNYLKLTGRSAEHLQRIKEYLSLQGLFGVAQAGDVQYTYELTFNLSAVVPCVAGPKRPQDRIPLTELSSHFMHLLKAPLKEGGYHKSDWPQVYVSPDGVPDYEKIEGGTIREPLNMTKENWSEEEMVSNRPFTEPVINMNQTEGQKKGLMSHGSIVIAAITSCTNTSNPSVMIGAGLVARKAVELGLTVSPFIKTSLAPGSRVVSDYLKKTHLQSYLDQLGFEVVAYGCTTCIGNSGPLDEKIEDAIKKHDLIAVSVLSGNRNFEARIHSAVKANFLMSPPLVVIYALAGTIHKDFSKEPVAYSAEGKPVFFKDLWPTAEEIEHYTQKYLEPSLFKERYANIHHDNPLWKKIAPRGGAQYEWDKESTYIQKPPYFEKFSFELPAKQTFEKMRCLAIFGDSVTTDHISPAGSFSSETPAGKYLLSKKVAPTEFNSYGSRRGNHLVMMRGTFANVRIKNKLLEPKEGGFTLLFPEREMMTIFEASEIYRKRNIPLLIFAGKDYGMGSSRDWAAKGSGLLGIRAVIAESFERIHRSNLIGMGILPLQFFPDTSAASLEIKGDELFSLAIAKELHPLQTVHLEIEREQRTQKVPLLLRIDTKIETDYFKHGGIMPYVLRQLLQPSD